MPRILGHAVALSLLVLWELAVRLEVLDSFWVSSPLMIADHLVESVSGGTLISDLYYTTSVALMGFAIGFVVAVVLLIAMTSSATVELATRPIVDALYAIPKVALIPVLILVFGIGRTSKVTLVVLLVTFIFLYNLREGLKDRRHHLEDALRIMGAGPREIFRRVRVPQLLPYATAGARIAGPQALVVAVFAEFFGSRSGIGKEIYEAGIFFDATALLTGIVAIVPVGLALDVGLRAIDRRVADWRVHD